MIATIIAYGIYAALAAFLVGAIRLRWRTQRRRERYLEWEASMRAEERERQEREQLGFDISNGLQ